MKIIPKEAISNISLPLKIYKSVHIADAISKEGEKFGIFLGLDKKYINQLRKLSLDESDIDLQKNTGDRARFGIGSYKDWYKKNRTPFCLIHKQTDALSALVWFGPLSLSENKNEWYTIGWRSYPPFRGKGLMKNFTEFAISIYLKNVPDIKLWVFIVRENKGSIKLATSLGFQISEKDSNNISLIMIKNK